MTLATEKQVSSKLRWKHHEDMTLVNTLTEMVSKGGEIAQGFSIAAERLNNDRTSQACYARWHTHLQKYYKDAILRAEEKAKENANRIVDEMLNQQSESSVEIENPSNIVIPLPVLNQPSVSDIPVMTTLGRDISSAITFLSNLERRVMGLESENSQLLEELETTITQLEEMRVQNEHLLQEQEKYKPLMLMIEKRVGGDENK